MELKCSTPLSENKSGTSSPNTKSDDIDNTQSTNVSDQNPNDKSDSKANHQADNNNEQTCEEPCGKESEAESDQVCGLVRCSVPMYACIMVSASPASH